ncbi:hypothetical protein PTSG_09685 [Salpingoeca rosetta]|uniref:DDE Tnp4 domain-containing protein n=1 Tax=Salpingoeca rosetta (strain ATCC 50818 / BSB-021) TaxID=946362 RepID=F2UNR0_SALR5|nr:uncharacterized protein PTSG_09685 [Salpingoeca rosetta]EGD79265.1 hypothetical protein PTSG_09685 [Salpingoeca rosetta]|eukprot:XP_004989036.1 hypothetical protein PTSG_09685 [Salpingoeca rosetta]
MPMLTQHQQLSLLLMMLMRRRRRRLLLALLLDDDDERAQLVQHTVPNNLFFDHYALEDPAFRMKYFVTKAQFMELYHGIQPWIPSRRHAQIDMRVVFAAVLHRLSSGNTYQRCQDAYGISRSLFHEYEHCIVIGLDEWLAPLITFPRSEAEVSDECRTWSDMDPQFEDCVGAADGTLIHFTPRGLTEEERKSWLCRKGFMSMNILVCIRHNRTFSFVASGFEAGACHDSYMVEQSGFLNTIPRGKYVLFDAGGPLVNKRMLTPYRNTRYHVSAFGGNPPVEQAIGHLKSRWKILSSSRFTCSIDKCIHYVNACVGLHNFIAEPQDDDDVEDEEDDDDDVVAQSPAHEALVWRDNIANKCFDTFMQAQ